VIQTIEMFRIIHYHRNQTEFHKSSAFGCFPRTSKEKVNNGHKNENQRYKKEEDRYKIERLSKEIKRLRKLEKLTNKECISGFSFDIVHLLNAFAFSKQIIQREVHRRSKPMQ